MVTICFCDIDKSRAAEMERAGSTGSLKVQTPLVALVGAPPHSHSRAGAGREKHPWRKCLIFVWVGSRGRALHLAAGAAADAVSTIARKRALVLCAVPSLHRIERPHDQRQVALYDEDA